MASGNQMVSLSGIQVTFEQWTICIRPLFLPFQYQTCLVFRSPLSMLTLICKYKKVLWLRNPLITKIKWESEYRTSQEFGYFQVFGILIHWNWALSFESQSKWFRLRKASDMWLVFNISKMDLSGFQIPTVQFSDHQLKGKIRLIS